MIKEIMLASSIMTTSLNTNYFYDVSSFGNRIVFEVQHAYLSGELGEYFILYNLSNGSYDICNVIVNEDDSIRTYEYDIYESFDGNYKPFISDYFIYTLNNSLGFLDGVPNATDYSSLIFGGYVHVNGADLIDNPDSNISYEFVIKEPDNKTLISISSQDYFYFNGNSCSEFALEVNDLMRGSFSVSHDSQDYYLLIKPNEISTYSFGDYITFDFMLDFSSYEFYYELTNGYSEGVNNLWDNFIYSKVLNYCDIVERNDYLTAENNRLNSVHAFSNIFDLVRGAINGVVDFMSIELMPNLTIGSLFFIPVVIGVIWFILKALVL